MGLATEDEVEELQHMRKLYPELDTEVDIVERRLEKAAFADAAMPPVEIRNRILQRSRWDRDTSNGDTPPNYTFINIQPKDNDHISVHKYWRFFLIFLVLLAKILLFFAIFYYLKYAQIKEQEKERLKRPAPASAIYSSNERNCYLL